MPVNFITISMAFILATSAAIPTTSKPAKSKTPADNFAEESNYYGGLSVLSPNIDTYTVPAVSQQSGFQLTIAKETEIGPKFDLFYLLESSLPMLVNLINTVQYVFQLLRSAYNVIVGNTSFFYYLLVKGITVLSNVFGFVLAIFSALSNKLSYATISKGVASVSAVMQPYPVYGVPSFH